MKYIQVYALFLMLVFFTSWEGQNKPDLPKDDLNSETKDTVPSYRSNDPNFHTQYEYNDSIGKRLIIQNGFPRGGIRYTDPNGDVYGYAVFWTRIINETDNPLELKIDLLESYEVPSLPGKYFKILVPPDTMTLDKEPLFNHGLTERVSTITNKRKRNSLWKY
jgi:hypothetical protein